MDELKELVALVVQLPEYALWALLGFLAYKLAVVGSVYSLCRFVVEKLYAGFTAPRVERFKINGHWMSEVEEAALNGLLTRAGSRGGTLAPDTVDRMHRALNLLEEQERVQPKKPA